MWFYPLFYGTKINIYCCIYFVVVKKRGFVVIFKMFYFYFQTLCNYVLQNTHTVDERRRNVLGSQYLVKKIRDSARVPREKKMFYEGTLYD